MCGSWITAPRNGSDCAGRVSGKCPIPRRTIEAAQKRNRYTNELNVISALRVLPLTPAMRRGGQVTFDLQKRRAPAVDSITMVRRSDAARSLLSINLEMRDPHPD